MPEHDWLDRWPGIRRHEPLHRHTQYGIGGAARWYLELRDTEPLGELLPRCHAEGIDIVPLGAGSNSLLLDGGIRGLAIQLRDRRLRELDERTVELSGGYMMPRAALDLARRGLAGLEFGIGIPGTCGASVRGNAGAFGTEIKDVLVDCDSIGPDGRVHRHGNADCGFSYRSSRFKTGLAGHIVIAARFVVEPDNASEVRRRTDAVQAQRKATQPYGAREKSLGSVFTNPPGDHAGRLLEAAGLKGRRIGGAQVSPKHANFIVNADHASAADVVALVELMHDEVQHRFGVDLEREIVYLGDPAPAPAGRRAPAGPGER